MDRRSLLRGAAAGTAAAGAGALIGQSPAHAADFRIIVTEQNTNRTMVFNKDAPFTDANVYKTFSPGLGTWHNLSDVRIRNTAAFGVVGLAAASGGKVGIWDITSELHQERGDVLWSATPGGNPHAIERIPNIGAIVTASSGGFLAVYGPTRISDPGTLARVQTVDLPGAHGVLWDPDNSYLWAVGDKVLRAYNVTGTYRNTRLSSAGRSVPLDGLGHDLQPDYSNAAYLFITDTYGTYRVDKNTLATTTVNTTTRIKAYVRHSSGEDFWIRGTNTGDRPWSSPTVNFSDSTDRTRSGAQFYKVRWYATRFR